MPHLPPENNLPTFRNQSFICNKDTLISSVFCFEYELSVLTLSSSLISDPYIAKMNKLVIYISGFLQSIQNENEIS